MTSHRSRTPSVAALLAACALVVAGCAGADDDGATTSTTQPAPSTTATTTAPPETTPSTEAPETTTTMPATTSTTSTSAAPPAIEGVTFAATIADETAPVLAPGDWDSGFTYAPWVVHHDGGFHLFYTGWGVDVAIGYATSEDGTSFTKVGDGPVLEWREEVSGRTAFPQAPVVYVADDGTWVMYFSELIGKRFASTSIRRATAPAPTGPWTVDDAPIYVATAGEWDDEAVPQSVVVTADEILLFYDGRTGTTAAAGVLRSADGLTFAPHDDPATPYGSDLILGPLSVQAWDGAGAGSPVAFATPDGLEMFYVGFESPESGERILRIGYAAGAGDGTAWRRAAANPMLELSSQRSAPGSLGYPWMGGVVVDGTTYLYYALGAGSEGIGLITGTVTAP